MLHRKGLLRSSNSSGPILYVISKINGSYQKMTYLRISNAFSTPDKGGTPAHDPISSEPLISTPSFSNLNSSSSIGPSIEPLRIQMQDSILSQPLNQVESFNLVHQVLKPLNKSVVDSQTFILNSEKQKECENDTAFEKQMDFNKYLGISIQHPKASEMKS